MFKKPRAVVVILTLAFLTFGSVSSAFADADVDYASLDPYNDGVWDLAAPRTWLYAAVGITIVAAVASSTPLAAATEEAALTQIAAAATATTAVIRVDRNLESTVTRVDPQESRRIAKSTFDH